MKRCGWCGDLNHDWLAHYAPCLHERLLFRAQFTRFRRCSTGPVCRVGGKLHRALPYLPAGAGGWPHNTPNPCVQTVLSEAMAHT